MTCQNTFQVARLARKQYRVIYIERKNATVIVAMAVTFNYFCNMLHGASVATMDRKG